MVSQGREAGLCMFIVSGGGGHHLHSPPGGVMFSKQRSGGMYPQCLGTASCSTIHSE